MESRHWQTLELAKVLDRLVGYASFSAGMDRCRELAPSSFPEIVRDRLAATREARKLLSSNVDVGMGGIHDVRPLVESALRGAALLPQELLDIRSTLAAGRDIHRTLTRLSGEYPITANIVARIVESSGVIAEIGRCIDDKGEIRDEASPALSVIRRELREAHSRLQDKLARIITSSRNAPYLQEALITIRDGRYVVPIKSDFKGRIPGIVHDQSSSGATLFIEPLSTVDLNNRWRELQLQEENEIRRVLHALSMTVAEESVYITGTVEALAELDLTLARAKYADATLATEPLVADFKRSGVGPGSTLRLLQARHPLIDPERVVPIDVAMDEGTFIVVITGPNTGGKTVALKTAGLLCLMACCGLHVPAAEGSVISVFDQIYADIGDEQSIEQSLSTFSSHLANLNSFLGKVGIKSLVLLDELGAGTDPAEGSALARAILDYLRERKVTTLVATHYPELKIWAHETPGAVNASVEFDPETLSPTYRLSIGLPGRSNAFAIAARLGLNPEIVGAARAMVSQSNLQAEDLLAEIHKARERAEVERTSAERTRAEVEKLERELRERLKGIEDERAHILQSTQDEMQSRLDTLEDEITALRRRVTDARAQELDAVESRRRGLAESAQKVASPKPSLAPQTLQHPIQKGDIVWVARLQSEGTVLDLDGDQAQVQAGRLRLRLDVDELEWRSTPQAPQPVRTSSTTKIVASPGFELDLRGETADDALARLDRHLDAAYLSGLPWVRIIHGHGTGALKRAVRAALRQHPLVANFEPGKENEGGDGVTVVKLAQDK